MKKISLFTLPYLFILFFSPVHADSNYTYHLNSIAQNTHLNKKIIALALKGYEYAKLSAPIEKNILTIVDYSQPSVAKRLYVIDLNTDTLLMNTWVAHGRNTGDLFSRSFSNQPESKKSSVGVFLTGDIYTGKHGKSMRLNGLEKNINDNAADRHLVVHAADYVSESFLKATGRMGRSFGCLAVNPQDLNRLIDLTKNGSVIFSYAQQEDKDKILAAL